jgi:hypothetical protein
VETNEDFLPNMNDFERILKQHHEEIKVVIVRVQTIKQSKYPNK